MFGRLQLHSMEHTECSLMSSPSHWAQSSKEPPLPSLRSGLACQETSYAAQTHFETLAYRQQLPAGLGRSEKSQTSSRNQCHSATANERNGLGPSTETPHHLQCSHP